MSTSGFTAVPAKPVRPSRRLTTWAYLVQLAYIPWLMVMFALGYAVYAMFDVEPGLGVDLFDQGLLGRLVNVAFYALLALPNWIGATIGARSRKVGGGRAASIAMWQNLTVGAVLMIFSLYLSV
jgi:hypothetical protein